MTLDLCTRCAIHCINKVKFNIEIYKLPKFDISIYDVILRINFYKFKYPKSIIYTDDEATKKLSVIVYELWE